MSLEYGRIETELPGRPKQHKPILVDSREAAKLLAISPRKLWGLTKGGEIPCLRIGKNIIRYAIDDLEKWIKANTN